MNLLFFGIINIRINCAKMQQINNVYETLTVEQKQSFAKVYARFAKPSWLNLITMRNTQALTAANLDPRLRRVYDENVSSEYGFHWIRFGAVRVLINPLFATCEFAPDTIILCADNSQPVQTMVNLTYETLTTRAIANDRRLCEYVILQTFAHAPDVEIFAILDNFYIESKYRYNVDNPEPRAITLRPLRSRGRQYERKVHKFVLADASERFRTTIYGSGTIKAKSTINIDCNVKLLDWFINGLYTGRWDLSLIRPKQRRHAYRVLNETMVCTPSDLGADLTRSFGIKPLDQPPSTPAQTYFDSDSEEMQDSDIDDVLHLDSDSD